MVRRVSKLEQKRRLRGWWKYAPALGLFFAAVALDAYLSKEMRVIDYEQGRLKSVERQLRSELKTLNVEAAAYQNVGMLEEQSIVLGMVDAKPQQIIPVHFEGIEHLQPVIKEELLAQVEEVPAPDLRAFLPDSTSTVAAATLATTRSTPAAEQANDQFAAVAPVELDYGVVLDEEDPEVLLESL